MPAAESSVRRGVSRKKSFPSAKPGKATGNSSWWDEIFAVIFFGTTIFLFLSLISYELVLQQVFLDQRFAVPGNVDSDIIISRANWMGPVGHFLASLLLGFLGWCALVPVFWTAWLSVYFWNYDEPLKNPVKRPGAFAVVFGLTGLLAFSCTLASILVGRHAGGSVGELLAEPLLHLFGPTGAALISGLLFLACLALSTRKSLADTTKSIFWLVKVSLLGVFVETPLFLLRVLFLSGDFIAYFWRLLFPKSDSPEEYSPEPRPRLRKNTTEFIFEAETEEKPIEAKEETYNVIVNRKTLNAARAKEREREEKRAKALEKKAQSVQEYRFPSLSLLPRTEPVAESENDEELKQISRQIELKLRDFSIEGRVTQVHPGPVITLFEFEPAAGVKVGKIAALQDDLAMSLRASKIRIIAPIPKRGTVGIEVPNRHREIVRLRDLLESESFVNAKSILSVPLGKDTSGEPVMGDIPTMPHLLMAGATGTGKSVCINSILVSLLYRAKPEEVGLILIDPKVLELSLYEGIPHLRVPVVTVPRQAKAVLQWAVNEMNRRYLLMQRFGVRGIDAYNRFVAGDTDEAMKVEPKPGVIELEDQDVIQDGIDNGVGVTDDETRSLAATELKPLPKILIVIDELADLMLSVGKEVEGLITRLAQKARASGIHLIVATQRPSVDVITGLIKANFPARLSFRVSSKIDSRTILDSMGAEKLLGLGDILFMQPGAEGLKRIHGAYISDTEVKAVVEAVRTNGHPLYDQHIMKVCDQALREEEEQGDRSSEFEGRGAGDHDEFYDKAVELVVDKGQASTSMIQRAFRIGYNRAARIIEMMEKEGVIGPMDGVKPREVLLTPLREEGEVG